MKKILAGLAILVALFAVVIVGGYFALKRPDIAWETLDKKYASAESKFMDLRDGVVVHYRDEGEPLGRTVVLVHGFSASLHTWEPWVAQLASKYRVVSLDLPGHGLTRTPPGYEPGQEAYSRVVEAVAKNLNLTRFTIVGSSMGGGVAWYYTLKHPERVEGLVLVAASGWPDARVDAADAEEPMIFQLLRNPTLGPLLRDLENRPMVKQGLEASFADPSQATDAMVDALLKITLGFKGREFATPERMAEIKIPTLVMHGDKDILVPVEGGRLFAKHIAGAQMLEYENIGHIPQEEIPERSGADLLALLNALPAPSVGQGAPVAAPATAQPKALEGVY
jgi:pimeloyl-ACP methyl ester carboxylesterase